MFCSSPYLWELDLHLMTVACSWENVLPANSPTYQLAYSVRSYMLVHKRARVLGTV